MATLGLNPQEKEAVEAFRRDVVEPSMTKLVILDFWAEWCGPCKAFAPVFEQAASQLLGKCRLAKLDSEANQQLAGQLGIRSIPSLILFKNGREVARQSGALPLQQLNAWLRSQGISA